MLLNAWAAFLFGFAVRCQLWIGLLPGATRGNLAEFAVLGWSFGMQFLSCEEVVRSLKFQRLVELV